MIDLSFLTEAEQEAILKVLNRDAELKKAEDERIRHLQNVLEDENELKYKTGEWFYEAKSRRHREKIHGADLVRASIRKRKKPATIAELSQSNKDKSRKSWVNSVNKDIFIPPELCGVMEEPEEDFEDLKQTKVQSNQSSKKVSFSPAQNKENLNNGTASPAKIRRNPFNSPLEEIETDGKHQPPDNGLPKRDILSSIIKYGVKLPYPDTQEATQDSRTTAESENSIVQVPTPKPRIMSLKKVSQPPYDSSTSLKEHSINSTGRPKGILKRWSSSSSTDSETVRISQGVDSNRIIFPGSPILEYETNLSKDGIDQSLEITNEQSKQVRFAANIMEKPPSPILESFSGREIGEFRILEPVIHQNEWEDPGIASSDDSTQLEHSSFPNSADFSEDRSEEVHSHSTNVQKTSNVHPNLNVENVIGTASPKGGRTNNTERLLEGQTNVISFTSHTNNSDLEPIYAVVNKSQKQSSPDKQPETDVPELPKPDFVEINQGSEEFNPVLNALQRITVKPIYVRGVQEMSPANSNQERTKEDVDLSDQEVPTEDSQVRSQFSNPEKLKRLSQSVPAFLEETDGRETDSASESSFQIGRHRKSPSSLTNLSSSSGMASLSSVSGSVMSVYSGDFGNVDVKGNIQFAIDYVEQLREFHIFVAQCKDLAVADLRKLRSDPYVKSYLLPDKAKMGKRKTAVRKKTVNPSYNEILRYKIEKQNLLNQTLNLSVWHNDALGRNSFLGEVDLNLATWDWSNKQMNWYPLQPRTPASGIGLENRGEMKLALKYIPEVSPGTKVPVTGEVHIWIKECYQLPMLRGNKINSFVKCTILPDTSRKSRQKTRTVDRTPNPVFNHTMVYDGFRYDDLGEACVELTVWDHNRLSNHFLGGLRLGLGTGKSYGTAVDWMDSSIEESTMWESMIKAPDTWIEGLVPLRMLRMAKLTK
ncbi:synaptotagmin-like protein 2 isoform X7 [Bombina bombina]|uniref:synaptotagmin-like protein 2 isoform X7 n=1 Tax=Bombina bombina TaxID=8345 RepID=UPI00235ABEE7|nr:synaptotagmin-like protein 2 isoform X7 [Bombina bombina]